jgi:hypothetical protein
MGVVEIGDCSQAHKILLGIESGNELFKKVLCHDDIIIKKCDNVTLVILGLRKNVVNPDVALMRETRRGLNSNNF